MQPLPFRIFSAALLLTAALSFKAAAQISYTSAGSTYAQNFDLLPKDAPQNATIENVYVNGWMDDTTTVAGDHVSLPGWYLYHPLSPANENGTNGNQRFRFGPGTHIGSFYAYGDSSSADDMALGSVGSNTVAAFHANMYFALRLVNATGSTLGSFTVRFDGEQWRDGQSAAPETLSFEYSLTALPADWNTTATFTPVPALNFSSPVFTGTANNGTAVNGNIEGTLAGINATVTGITWAPGTELWLRWADPNIATDTDPPTGLTDDGLAIDNFSFTAALAPPGIPDAKLGFRIQGGRTLLEWQGATGLSYQVQHSTDLQAWTSLGDPAPETTGIMTYVIPPALLNDGRRFFRLLRAALP